MVSNGEGETPTPTDRTLRELAGQQKKRQIVGYSGVIAALITALVTMNQTSEAATTKLAERFDRSLSGLSSKLTTIEVELGKIGVGMLQVDQLRAENHELRAEIAALRKELHEHEKKGWHDAAKTMLDAHDRRLQQLETK